MSRRAVIFPFLFTLLCGFAFQLSAPNPSLAAAPSTTQSASQIAGWFTDLANGDASVREQARIALMGISRDDLNALHTLVEENSPLAPSQALALREIVQQIFQATEPYEPMEDRRGFLGITLPTIIMINAGDDESQAGLLVTDRVPGFCGYRYLQSGDVISGIAEAPDRAIRIGEDLTRLISAHKAGETIHLQVIRGGQQMEVAVKLDARPTWAIGPQDALVQRQLQPPQDPPKNPPQYRDIVEARRERQRKADEYWEQNFARLVETQIL